MYERQGLSSSDDERKNGFSCFVLLAEMYELRGDLL